MSGQSGGESRRRHGVQQDVSELREFEWIPFGDVWMFVVGYTDGGAPYGTTLDELPEPYRSELLAELEAGNQPPFPPLDEVETDSWALWSAASADELHYILVMEPPDRSIANHFEPMMLLHKHHRAEPTTSATTAVLMLTDARWKGATGRLAASVAESGILDDEVLDMLAHTFLKAEDAVYWNVPAHWFQAYSSEAADRDTGPVVARRTVSPALRRWASAHAARVNPDRWSAVYARTEHLSSKHAAAVMAGLLDAIDHLAPGTQEFLTTQGMNWPDMSVRRSAYTLYAERCSSQDAYRLATSDPSSRIRSWAKTLVKPPPVKGPDPFSRPKASPQSTGPQPPQADSLF